MMLEIIRFGERAARAFPDLPMLGVDILKEAGTGRLFVTEVNALGHNWNFSREFSQRHRHRCSKTVRRLTESRLYSSRANSEAGESRGQQQPVKAPPALGLVE